MAISSFFKDARSVFLRAALVTAGVIAVVLFLHALVRPEQAGDVSEVARGALEEKRLPGHHIVLNKAVFVVYLADTPALREQGLSGRESLAPGAGMLFVFDDEARHGMWMKDMLFPIDIVWFDREFRVVGVKERATSASFPEIFYPSAPAHMALEVRAGSVAERGIVVGDRAEFFSED